MDNDGPADWPPDGYSEGDGADLGGPDEGALPDPDLGYDAHDSEGPADGGYGDTGYDVDPDGADSPDEGSGLGDGGLGGDAGLSDDAPVGDDTYPEAPVGTDPDADPLADDEAWRSDPFPEALDLDQPPEPVDGMPWSDPALLGDSGGDGTEPLGDPATGDAGSPPVNDLYAYDGGEPPTDGTDAWGSLAGSEDPATSSLARFWSPGG